MRRKALITGINGFTGPFLAEELKLSGYEVIGTSSQPRLGGKNVITINLCDLASVRELVLNVQPEIVVNLAAVSFVAHGDVSSMYATNVVGTRNLLQALDECRMPPQVVLLPSSAHVYGNLPDDPINEMANLNPANDYAVSKLAMENMASLWKSKLPIIIARPFNYTGFGQDKKFLIPKIVDHYIRGVPKIELGNLDIARDFSDVRFVSKVYRMLIEAAPIGETFNICSGKATRLADIVEILSNIAQYKIKVEVNPLYVRENEISTLRGSNAKLIDVVGELNNISIDDTLRWMYTKGLEAL